MEINKTVFFYIIHAVRLLYRLMCTPTQHAAYLRLCFWLRNKCIYLYICIYERKHDSRIRNISVYDDKNMGCKRKGTATRLTIARRRMYSSNSFDLCYTICILHMYKINMRIRMHRYVYVVYSTMLYYILEQFIKYLILFQRRAEACICVHIVYIPLPVTYANIHISKALA